MAIAAASVVLGLGPVASAQSLATNRYAIDLFQGPILAPLRVTGIAGAYAGYAEGIAGMVASAAAPALREPFSANHVEADIAGSVSIPIEAFENNDFDNSGDIDADYSNFIYLTLGGQLQVGPFGAGVTAELQRYSLRAADGLETAVVIGKYHVLAGGCFFGGQLVVGGGARAVTLGLDAPETSLTMAGIAPELGFLIRPDWESFRFGATFRLPVNGGELLGDAETVDPSGLRRAGGLLLPNEVVLPWELELGLSVQVGPRPLNPSWINPRNHERELRRAIEHRREERERRRAEALRAIDDPEERAERQRLFERQRERELAADARELDDAPATLKQERRARYANWPREHLLLTAELLVTGAVDDGVSLERFLGQNQPDAAPGRGAQGDEGQAGAQEPEPGPSAVGTSGASVSFSPRFGIETEPIPGRVHTRFGSYYEPSRFGGVGRQHFTFGADVRVFSTTFWGLVPEVAYKLQASVDLAPRYESVSAGIGVWH